MSDNSPNKDSFLNSNVSRALEFERELSENMQEEKQPAPIRPPADSEGPEDIVFEDLFDLEDVQRLQDQFAVATGVASIITHVDGSPITSPSNFCCLCNDIIRKTEKGLANCFKSDAVLGCLSASGPIVQPCLSGGLWDAGAGISVEGKHIANWLIGQVRDETQTEEKMLEYARQIGADEKAFLVAFRKVPSMPLQQFQNVAQMLFTFANQLSATAYQNVQQARLISKLKQAEESLRVSNERYYQVTTNLPGLVYQFVVHADGSYSMPYVSEGVKAMFGVSPEEVYHDIQSLLQLIHPDDVIDFEKSIQKSAESFSPYNYEFRTVVNGYVLWINALSRPKKLSNGDILWDGILLDVTERKKAEVEKAHLEDRLQQAQKMEAVGQLAGGVAHDFNNMLSVILGHSEMAMEQIDTGEPLYASLKEIHKAAERSANITKQLLAFARKQTIAPKVLDLNETVEGMLKMLRRLIGEDIDLVWKPESGLWQVKVDPSQIDQILANLCINARTAISGVGKITVMTENCTLDEDCSVGHTAYTPGDYVRITVSDNGCGMDKMTLHHIFEPFFTTKAVGEGTGLGLATVFGAVKQNNGIINVYSEPGLGTSVTIYLPRYLGNIEQGKTSLAMELAAHGLETILLVEDESTILSMMVKVLESLGYTVLAASSPDAALRLMFEFPGEVQLLMTDVVMPGMNGRDLADRLRKDYPTMKFLFMSGYTANVITNQGVLNEGTNFIQKPFSKKELAAKVRQVLESRES